MADTTTIPVISDVGREYLRIHLTADVGPVRLRRLVEHLGSLAAVRDASMAALEAVEGVGPALSERLFESRCGDDADARMSREIERAAELGLRIVCAEDDAYPAPLRHIPDPPVCLYVRGALDPADAVAVSIVGTRRCSHYGVEQARRLSGLLAGAGFTVVSGLARGIDGHAHRGALACGGRTVAVLGNGLPAIYPREHGGLADEIAACGAIVSELPLDTAPERGHFPARNRIIAGMTLGVIVVEAGERSGALITARLANEYNREVFAVPGRVDQPGISAGVNRLIRDGGAKLVTCLEDVLDELGAVGDIMAPTASDASGAADADGPTGAAGGADGSGGPRVRLTDTERAVFDALRNGCGDPDAVCAATGRAIAAVTATLTTLQLKGVVRQLPGNRFEVRTRGG
ncbi:MAG: DNA-processing protein DprA [Phycisphaerae bacterium]